MEKEGVIILVVSLIVIAALVISPTGKVIQTTASKQVKVNPNIESTTEEVIKTASEAIENERQQAEEDRIAEAVTATLTEQMRDYVNNRVDEINRNVDIKMNNLSASVLTIASQSGGFTTCRVVEVTGRARAGFQVCQEQLSQRVPMTCIAATQETYNVDYRTADCTGRDATIKGFETHLASCDNVQLKGTDSGSTCRRVSAVQSTMSLSYDKVICCGR